MLRREVKTVVNEACHWDDYFRWVPAVRQSDDSLLLLKYPPPPRHYNCTRGQSLVRVNAGIVDVKGVKGLVRNKKNKLF